MLVHQTRFSGVVITGHGRTGSSWLHSLLSSHPQLRLVGGEPFQEGFSYDAWKHPNKTPRLYLEQLVRNGPIAIKYMWPAVHRFKLFDDFHDLGFHTIHSYRNRLLDVYISWRFHASKLSGNKLNIHNDRISIDREKFEEFARQYDHVQKQLRAMVPNAIIVCYEEFRANTTIILNQIQDKLRLPITCLSSDKSKILKRSQSEIVMNFEEIKDLSDRIYTIEDKA